MRTRFDCQEVCRTLLRLFLTHSSCVRLSLQKSPKPDIVVYNFDRDYSATKRHFSDCFARYGSPCAVLSLIKKEEKTAQETRLGMAFNQAIQKVSAQFRMDRVREQINSSAEPVGQSREQVAREELARIQDQIARDGNTPFPAGGANGAGSVNSSPVLGSTVAPSAAALPADDRVFAARAPPYDHPSYEPNSILYCTYDFLGQRAKQGNVLRDLKGLVSNLVDEIGVFTYLARPPVTGSSMPSEDACVVSVQKGVIRVNCIDCLDRTNVGMFCIGKAAIKIQLKNLGISLDAEDTPNNSILASMTSSPSSANNDVYPELVAILQDMYTQHGDRIAHQYAGSGAMHKGE
jgi:hypothetical protein